MAINKEIYEITWIERGVSSDERLHISFINDEVHYSESEYS